MAIVWPYWAELFLKGNFCGADSLFAVQKLIYKEACFL